MPKKSLILFILLLSAHANAWTDHHLITRQALMSLPAVDSKVVTVTPFQAVLDHQQQLFWELGYRADQSFNENLKIRKDYVFSFRVGEQPGRTIKAIDVLAVYSDEPDWEMDTELFGEGQYPELWKPEYAMMGGKTGTASQSFRHMFWRSLNFREPLETLHLPPETFFRSMGTAPERARVFVTLARAAWGIPGLEYWALRFLADSLHYVEDVSQPYHASQLPTPKFLTLALFDRDRGSMKGVVQEVQNILSYYHFAYEDYVAREMQGEAGQLADALSVMPSPADMRDLDYSDRDPARLVEQLSDRAVGHASQAANASLEFFPEIPGKFADFDAKAFMNDAWWTDVIRRGESPSPAKQAYFGTVEPMFTLVGEAVRRLVAAEVRLK
jgi:hypothetical protein